MTPDQLFDRTIPEPNSGCWLWVGAVDKHGYGVVKTRPQVYAHRLSYQVHCGEIPAGQHVLHSCDQPCCANPAHLRVGSARDNAQDRAKRGRGRKQGRLSEEQVREILADARPSTAVAKDYGVHPSHIRGIRCGVSWKKVA